MFAVQLALLIVQIALFVVQLALITLEIVRNAGSDFARVSFGCPSGIAGSD